MVIELYIFAFVIIAYGCFTTIALYGIGILNRYVKPVNEDQLPFISIIISARNEENHILRCLEQFTKQNYPTNRLEIILTDDASEDNTFDLAQQWFKTANFHYHLIKQHIHKGKKTNVAEAIAIAKGTIIVTSDADVVFRYSTWLTTIGSYFKVYNPNMLIMPVDFQEDKNILSAFQIIENMALTAITAGYVGIQKPFLCNGANLAFKKDAYLTVNGYHSHLHISSGEDIFLMEDLKALDVAKVHYLFSRELIVKTIPQSNLVSLFRQRIRWASKTKYNKNALNLFSAFIVLLANMLLVALLVAILKKSFIIPYLSIFVAAKVVFDFLLLFLASNFLGRIKFIWLIIPFECIYWCYALSVGITSFFIKPTWKGKNIN